MDEATVGCPRCGMLSQLAWPLRRSAEEFCSTCDYPLFWAPTPDPPDPLRPPGTRPSEESEREHATCGRCGHPNPIGSRFCNQCGESLE